MRALISFVTLIAILIIGSTTSAFSQAVSLKNAREAAVPIAIQSFIKSQDTPQASKVTTDIEAMLTADLIFSRIFKVISSEAFLESSVTGPLNVLKVDSWRQVGAQYVVRGRVSTDAKETTLEGFAFDVASGKLLVQKTYKTKRSDTAILAHEFGDDIVEIVTGKKGLFSTKIAFVYQPPNKRGKEIWLMDFNGRNARPLVQNNRTNLTPNWTRDGRSIYFTSSSTIHWHIWKTDLNGKTNQVTNFRGSALGPRMMPNGREMVASLSKDGDTELYLLGLDGSVKRRLTKSAGIDISPYPNADGSKICFSSDRLGNLHVFTLDMRTEETTRLTRVGTLNDSCAWNPFENSILFSGMDADREFDIFGMDDRGTNMERLTYDAKNNESPSFSPDGQLVVFSSRRSGRNQIYVMRKDGTMVDTIVPVEGDASQPSWSPRLGY